MGSKFLRHKSLTVAKQVFRMKTVYPHFLLIKRKEVAIWTGTIRPSPMSEEYRLQVAYKLGDTPKVRVLSPQLQKRADQNSIPHTYSEDRLCLYRPGSGEWHPRKLIAVTILPWISLWLYYYEVWHATGKWLGGGIHPPPKK